MLVTLQYVSLLFLGANCSITIKCFFAFHKITMNHFIATVGGQLGLAFQVWACIHFRPSLKFGQTQLWKWSRTDERMNNQRAVGGTEGVVRPSVGEWPKKFGHQMMQFSDTVGRKLGYLWVRNLALLLLSTLHPQLSHWTQQVYFGCLIMIVKQISLPLCSLMKSHIVHALVNDVMLNTRVECTVYISVYKKHGQLVYIPVKLVKTLSVSVFTYITNVIKQL